jgi:hypothetical protein
MLTAVPAKFVLNSDSGTQTLIIKPLGKKYGLAIVWVTTMKEIKEAISRFAEQVHRRFPDYSFAVTEKIRAGDPAPACFETALLSGALGQRHHSGLFKRCTLEEYLADDFKHHADQACAPDSSDYNQHK